jgi:hypothetical protein
MKGPVFESVYRDKLWRIELSEYNGQKRLSIWPHYQHLKTGELRPCGGGWQQASGCIVPVERVEELAAALSAMAEHLRVGGQLAA